MIKLTHLVLPLFLVLVYACGNESVESEGGPDSSGRSAPTSATIEANAVISTLLPQFDDRDLGDVSKGLIARDPTLSYQAAYDFVKGKAPDSVNPSLWRQESLNNIHGLFEVDEGLYQLRGFDLANITLIQGESGWIVIDPLGSTKATERAMSFAAKHLGERPVSAIIFTHSHVDHFGGVLGVITPDEVKRQGIPIVAPVGFMEESSSENVMAGLTMARRTNFSYGTYLPRDDRGHVGLGLGKHLEMGLLGLLEPTHLVDRTPQSMAIDGIDFVFQNVPGSEAPAELTFFLPKYRAFFGAELVSRTMHNVYTLRGAKVRDALTWSRYIDEALNLFGDADIYLASHHWPIWGEDRVAEFLRQQRDTYKYIHDQTLRLAGQGLTPREIAAELRMPESLARVPASRGYYGTPSHNARAVYQHYFGWFDGNPAHLNPLPPEAAGERYVSLAGGADKLLARAERSYNTGDYRWVAELLNHLVFAEPGNKAARTLLASAYDQLGYQAESGPWRDIYLTGALELRSGNRETNSSVSNARAMLQHTPLGNMLDAMATRLDGPAAEGVDISINMTFADEGINFVLWIENSVLHHREAEADANANATLTLTKDLYLDMAIGEVSIGETLLSDDLTISGSKLDLLRFFALIEVPDMAFNIVEP
ncbi:MAG: alkyl sulfatase BDS1-like metallo-beta-lactamase superfamily hydrolase [Halieaceae bacterium]|jgi:alkyl sulfatase BDS1-like metallo-beta-lactamase superfamily hydrolase